MRVERNIAFVNLAMMSALERGNLSDSDAALTTDLTYGVTRRRNTLDWFIEQLSDRPLNTISLEVLTVLRLAAYEALFRPPTHAFVVGSQYTELARHVGHEGIARFVNAICRKLTSIKPDFPPFDKDPIEHIVCSQSHPRWIVERWVDRYGASETLDLCKANNEPPMIELRVNSLSARVDQVSKALRLNGFQVEAGRLHPCALRVRGGRVEKMPGFRAGWFVPQGEASMLIAEALQPQPGEIVVDACAGPGGKTTHVGALMRNEGEILAVDTHESRISLVRRACARTGVTIAQFHVADFRQFTENFPGKVDRCLVDAPCSGTGALRRKPDLRWRLLLEDLERLALLQSELLNAAARIVRPGGVIVYSTCSLESEENENVVGSFLNRHNEFALDPPTHLPITPDEDGFVRTFPHRHNSDGMFIAKVVRRA